VPDEVHEVGGILAVVDGERGVEADLGGHVAQQARTHGMEGAGPGQGLGQEPPALAQDLGRDPGDAAGHLDGGPAREGHQQDAPRVGAPGPGGVRRGAPACWSCPTPPRR
jgi:hypothetical protein